MKRGRRQNSLWLLALVFLLSFLSEHACADSHAQLTPLQVNETLKNKDGKTPCQLQDWMLSAECRGSASASTGDENSRRAVQARANGDFVPRSCTCTLPFFNIHCGCLLSKNAAPANYTQWRNTCAEANQPIDQDMGWLSDLSVDIPLWSYIVPNNGSFFTSQVRAVVSLHNKWSLAQIIAPVVVGTCTFILVTIFFVYWQRTGRHKAKNKRPPTFLSFVKKVFTPSTRSIHHDGRDEDWKIDPDERVADDTDDPEDSFVLVPPVHSIIESPVEVSHWSRSPTVDSVVSPPRRSRYSFRPRQPSQLGTVDERTTSYQRTIRSLSDLVRGMVPWASRPTPVTNVRPGSRYNINGDQTPRRGSRSTTMSSPSTRRAPRGYATISEENEEDPDMVGTGRTRTVERWGTTTSTGHMGARGSIITDEDRAAVAGSVILIGDRDFTLESGSTGQHGTPSRPTPVRGGFGNVKSPSDRLDFQVEPPSPTLESAALSPRGIPPSPGAPPLLPPAPQQRPPLPPITLRDTPRRTPSPNLRIDTRIGDTSSYHSHKPSGSNSTNNANTEPYMHPALRPSNSDLQQEQAQRPQSLHRRDLSGSDSNTNALSYVSVPHPLAHQHARSQSDNRSESRQSHLIPERNPSPTSRRRSGSGSRLLPPQPTGGRAPSPHNPGKPTYSPPQLTHQNSETSMGQFSILRTPDVAVTDRRRLSSSGETTQSEFDPYAASGVPRPFVLQPNRRQDGLNNHQPPNQSYPYGMHQHQRSTSSTSLPRAPGEPLGQHHRGWSADDDADSSSLIGHPPMEVDESMGSGGRSVYLAEPRSVNAGGHIRHLSRDSFMTDYGNAESVGDGRGAMGEDESPPLSALEADPRNRSNFAGYAGRESISGSSGWDASTQYTHGTNISPIDPPPRVATRTPNLHHIPVDPDLTPNRHLSPNVSPRLGGHARLGSGGAGNGHTLQNSRSRENILAPARSDPLSLFPASVRAAGYTTGLEPDAIPAPTPSPRPPGNGNGNGNGHAGAGGNNGRNGGPIAADISGYVERNRAQTNHGGTWDTESSGRRSVLEPVQQLPDVYTPPSTVSRRTP